MKLDIAARLKNFLRVFREKLQSRTYVIRLFAAVITVDFIAIASLGSLNPLHMINPLRFLQAPPLDHRAMVKLYFLRSFQPEENEPGEAPKGEDSDLSAELIEVEQKLDLSGDDSGFSSVQAFQAWLIIQQMIAGPDNLQARKFAKEKDFIRSVWFRDGNLIVHGNAAVWKKYPEKTRALARLCLEKSILGNVAGVSRVSFTES